MIPSPLLVGALAKRPRSNKIAFLAIYDSHGGGTMGLGRAAMTLLTLLLIVRRRLLIVYCDSTLPLTHVVH